MEDTSACFKINMKLTFKAQQWKAKALVEEELNQREIDFELNNNTEQTNDEANQFKVRQIGSSIKNNSAKSNKILKD